ncbi:hypothetical protein ZIOFF_030355 [Zingiber officinale]|uniref:Uncharacterized protein n=1 Tax=Zingiber officinale TaxID=94328 RepID=A0A8J5GVC0_ZINOF|nr:hypothetical protein ZIOFF_030355 [Zingiber officinale]
MDCFERLRASDLPVLDVFPVARSAGSVLARLPAAPELRAESPHHPAASPSGEPPFDPRGLLLRRREEDRHRGVHGCTRKVQVAANRARKDQFAPPSSCSRRCRMSVRIDSYQFQPSDGDGRLKVGQQVLEAELSRMTMGNKKLNILLEAITCDYTNLWKKMVISERLLLHLSPTTKRKSESLSTLGHIECMQHDETQGCRNIILEQQMNAKKVRTPTPQENTKLQAMRAMGAALDEGDALFVLAPK